MGEVVSPRALTWSGTCHQWFMYGLNANRTLPTIWVHMCSVARVGSQASSGSAGQRGSCSVMLGLLRSPPSLLPVLSYLISRTRQPPKGCDKAVDVFLVVVDARPDPRAADAGCGDARHQSCSARPLTASCPSLLLRKASRLQGPAPAKDRYKNTKQNRIARLPPLRMGKKPLGACPRK